MTCSSPAQAGLLGHDEEDARMNRWVRGLGSLLLIGCSSVNQGAADGGAPDAASNTDAGTPDATDNDAGGDAQVAGALGFTPSNIDLSGLDLTKAGDVTLSDGV